MEFQFEIVEKNAKVSDAVVELLKSLGSSRYYVVPRNIFAVFTCIPKPVDFFGNIIKSYSLGVFFYAGDNKILDFNGISFYDDDEPDNHLKFVEIVIEIAKGVSVNGKKINLENIQLETVAKTLMPSFDDDEDIVDFSPEICLNIDDESTTYVYEDGLKKSESYKIRKVNPDISLYRHYDSIFNNPLSFLSRSGGNVEVNKNGTEYEFISLAKSVEYDLCTDEKRPVFERIVNLDLCSEKYDLYEKAKAMQPLFRVNKSVFDPKHDRECELEEGYMQRAYMMSALRSFAWTLSDYCETMNKSVSEVDNSMLEWIIEQVANRDWLNYEGASYCKGLCSGGDLHGFYIPDRTLKSDKNHLLPSKEDYARVKDIQKNFPSYNEIFSEIHSLDELRKDLNYIYPAILTLWNELLKNRNYNKPLTGGPADIVYAWCALALASNGPFFTEDGPMNCYFDQIEKSGKKISEIYLTESSHKKETPELLKTIESSKSPNLSKSSKSSKSSNSSSEPSITKIQRPITIEKEYKVDRNESEFIIYGTKLIKWNRDKKILSVPEGVTEIGDNLISWDHFGLRIIELPEGVVSIGDEAFCHRAEYIYMPDSIRHIGKKAFLGSRLRSIYLNDNIYELEDEALRSVWSLKEIILPKNLISIGSETFANCNELKRIVIPNGVKSICSNSFNDCKNLEYLYIPESVTEIKNIPTKGWFGIPTGPFNCCNKLTVYCPSGSYAERYMIENNIKYKNSMPPLTEPNIKPRYTSPRIEAEFEAYDKYIAAFGKYANHNITIDFEGKNFVFYGFTDTKIPDIKNSKAKMLSEYIKEKGGKVSKKISKTTDYFIVAPQTAKETQMNEFIELKKQGASVEFILLEELEDAITYRMNRTVFVKGDMESEKKKSLETKAKEVTRVINKEPERPLKLTSKEVHPLSDKIFSENDILFMFAILRNEKNLNRESRTDNDFSLKYCGVFSSLKPSEILALRDKVKGKMKKKYGIYTDQIRKLDVEERVKKITLSYYKNCNEPNEEKRAEIAVEKTAWCYSPNELHFAEEAVNSQVTNKKSSSSKTNASFAQAVTTVRSKNIEKYDSEITEAITEKKAMNTSHDAERQELPKKGETTEKKEGCYIATAVYGSYDAPEVMTLRMFRDKTLKNSVLGRWFIRTYYRLSPPVAAKLRNTKRINGFVRLILDKFVSRLNGR